MIKENDWWTDFFPAFRPFFDIITAKDTAAEVSYIAKKLQLKKGSRFLDCPCGIGRISIHLAKKGIRVTGVDITESYIEELAMRSKRLKLKLDLVHADMRRLNFDREFDAAGNIGTSFGYFEKDSDNLQSLKKMYAALKAGGKFMLNVMNRDWIIKNFTPVAFSQVGNIRVFQRRQFDFVNSLLSADWIFLFDGEERTYRTVIRLYSYHELRAMMYRAGFTDIQGYGSTKDDAIDFNSRMVFVIGTKP